MCSVSHCFRDTTGLFFVKRIQIHLPPRKMIKRGDAFWSAEYFPDASELILIHADYLVCFSSQWSFISCLTGREFAILVIASMGPTKREMKPVVCRTLTYSKWRDIQPTLLPSPLLISFSEALRNSSVMELQHDLCSLYTVWWCVTVRCTSLDDIRFRARFARAITTWAIVGMSSCFCILISQYSSWGKR